MEQEPRLLRWFCVIFGIYRISRKELFANGKLFSKQRFILKSFQLIYPYLIFLYVFFISVYGIVSISFQKGYALSWLVATLVYVFQTVTHLIIILEAHLKYEEHEELQSKIFKTSLKLRFHLKAKSWHEGFYQLLNKTFIALSMFSIAGIGFYATILILLRDMGYFQHALLSILTMRLRFIQLLIYIKILEKLLTDLNLKLLQVVECKTEQNLHVLDIDLVYLKSADHLQTIKDIYTDIFDCFDRFNELSGWSLFAIIACYFLDFTCNFYWLLLAFDDLLPHLYILSTLATLVPMAVIFCYVSRASHSCKNKGRQTSRLITKLNSPFTACTSTHYRDIVYNLSLQLQQQTIKISAKEFFHIDKGFTMAIFTAIATHLVILIQFLKSDQPMGNIFVDKKLKD